MGYRSKRKGKFNIQLLEIEDNWLEKHPDDPSLAKCVHCNVILRLVRYNLTRHKKTKKHLKLKSMKTDSRTNPTTIEAEEETVNKDETRDNVNDIITTPEKSIVIMTTTEVGEPSMKRPLKRPSKPPAAKKKRRGRPPLNRKQQSYHTIDNSESTTALTDPVGLNKKTSSSETTLKDSSTALQSIPTNLGNSLPPAAKKKRRGRPPLYRNQHSIPKPDHHASKDKPKVSDSWMVIKRMMPEGVVVLHRLTQNNLDMSQGESSTYHVRDKENKKTEELRNKITESDSSTNKTLKCETKAMCNFNNNYVDNAARINREQKIQEYSDLSDSDTEENSSVENESHNIAKRKKIDSERCSSDCSEPLDNADVTNKPNEQDNTRNLTDNNQPSDTPEKEKSTESNQEQKAQESSGSEETDKSTDDKEKTPDTEISASQSAIDLLGAISFLAVIDLEKDPQRGLDIRILAATSQLQGLMAQKKSTPKNNALIASTQYDLKLLNIAKKYLRIFGTFGKVSEHLQRKASIAITMHIKDELDEEESNQNSFMFSQPTHLNRSSYMPKTAELTANNNSQMQNFPAARSTVQPTPIEHLESEIAAMNNATMNNSNHSHNRAFLAGGTTHNYPVEQMNALNHAVAAPAPITPRNDYLGNDSGETPSRGSGLHTPARPESVSQSDDTASLIQIKEEHDENTNLPSSQYAYAQNNEIPLPHLQIHLPVSNADHTYTNQTNYSVPTGGIAPNRTVAYNHQNYSNMYTNVAYKPQMQITPATTSAEMRQNQQMLLEQQMYIENGSGLCSEQAVPSLNTNQYVLTPSYTTANIGGTIIVNNTQVGQNALLTNVTNQPFYESNAISQLYYPPSGQMNCIPSNTIPTVITPDATAAAQVQQTGAVPVPVQHMVCVRCNRDANLRCRQCSRVPYCSDTCAEIYWHQKHNMECEPTS